MRRLAALLLALALAAPLRAAPPAPFAPDTLAHITAERAGRPFLLALWSLDCPPCFKELELLGRERARFAPSALVLVSTDGPERHAEVAATLARFGLAELPHFAFAGTAERLRHAIDPAWFGELPRSYFYRADGTRRARSGALDEAVLGEWLGGGE